MNTTSGAVVRSPPPSSVSQALKLALLEELPNAPHGICGSELLKHPDNAQCLGLRLLEPMLSMLKVSLQPHRASQDVCVITVGRVQFGFFHVSVGVIKPAFIEGQDRHTALD